VHPIVHPVVHPVVVPMNVKSVLPIVPKVASIYRLWNLEATTAPRRPRSENASEFMHCMSNLPATRMGKEHGDGDIL
jgi:hypothetical protein